VSNEKNKIKSAIETALHDTEFLGTVKNCINPYGDGKSAERIVKVLKEIPLSKELIKKNFMD
jgi:GDP/UDP-N,N'-diacetylbacillosamine 2-epimerase (hydrolysing)